MYRGYDYCTWRFHSYRSIGSPFLWCSRAKIFPASLLGPDGIKAISAVLPLETDIIAVGGVSDSDFAGYRAAGVTGFGLGSSLFKPGDLVVDVISRGRSAIANYSSGECS